MTQFLVLAKSPVPGRVKTRLCPPWTYEQAARVAAAALSDTLVTVGSTSAASRTLVVDGSYSAPAGWQTLQQRGGPLSDRIAGAFADADGDSAVLLGMDTPQITAVMLNDAGDYAGADATLGPAADGGWWALGLRDRSHAEVLRTIPTSTEQTGRLTFTALRDRGLRVRLLPVLRDVDTVADARSVATLCRPESSFRAVVEALSHER